jgi:hypothetical protein
VYLEASTKLHVYQKFEIFWTNIASTMAYPNFRNGPKNGLGPLGVNFYKNPIFGLVVISQNAFFSSTRAAKKLLLLSFLVETFFTDFHLSFLTYILLIQTHVFYVINCKRFHKL